MGCFSPPPTEEVVGSLVSCLRARPVEEKKLDAAACTLKVMFYPFDLPQNLQLDTFAGCCLAFVKKKQWASTWARADKRGTIFPFFPHQNTTSPLWLVSPCVFFLLSSIQTGLCSVISKAGPRLRSIDRPNELCFRAWVTQSDRSEEGHRGLRDFSICQRERDRICTFSSHFTDPCPGLFEGLWPNLQRSLN